MSVEKYKPKSTSHVLQQQLEKSFHDLEKTAEASKDAMARSRRLLHQSHEAIQTSKQLRRRAAGSRG